LKYLDSLCGNPATSTEFWSWEFFGSVARDEAKDGSDVDVVIRMKTPDPYFVVHIKEALEQRLDHHVDIVRLREKMNSFLKQRIEKEAVYV
jgi:predicted nucleotidyltransferase